MVISDVFTSVSMGSIPGCIDPYGYIISDVFTSVSMGSIPGVVQLLAYREHVEILDFQHTPSVLGSVSS
jgi:hypothetical protein